MPLIPRERHGRWASRIIVLFVIAAVCCGKAVWAQTSESADGAAAAPALSAPVKLGALWAPPADEGGGTASGGTSLRARWDAFWSHLTGNVKHRKKPKKATAHGGNPLKRVVAHVKSGRGKTPAAKVASATGSKMASAASPLKYNNAIVRCSTDGKMSVGSDKSFDLQAGDMLISARQPLTVHCGAVHMSIGKGTIVFLSNRDNVVKIRNLEEPRLHTVQVAAPGKTFTLHAGEELAIGNTYSELYASLSRDKVLRRQLKNYRLEGDRIGNTAEFEAVSVIKRNQVLMALKSSHAKDDRVMFKKILKMSACLTMATASHGWYLPVHYEPPSQEQTAVAAVGIPAHQ